MNATRRTRFGLRVLGTLGVGLALALAGAAPAMAEDTEYGTGDVAIYVTISELDLCELGLHGCNEGEGALGSTGLSIATPLGAGVLAVALGLGSYALGRRRRDQQA